MFGGGEGFSDGEQTGDVSVAMKHRTPDCSVTQLQSRSRTQCHMRIFFL